MTSAPPVHVLLEGKALCGLGAASEWPPGHQSVSADEWPAATCERCLLTAQIYLRHPKRMN
jgi:hypothetical protein